MADENTTPDATPTWTPAEQNGTKEYRPGSVGARVWALADAITARTGAWCSAAQIVEEGSAAGINAGSCRAGYATWRKFHGLAGTRIDDPAKAAKKAEVEAAKVALAAEAKAAKVAKAEAAAAVKAEKDAAKAEKARVAAEAKAAKAAEKQAAKEAAAAEAAAQTPPAEPVA